MSLKQKTRAGAALMLLTLLSAMPAAAADVDAALGLMPADTSIVVGVNLDRFRKSSIFKDLAKAMEANPNATAELARLKEAGLDPRTNLDTVFVALPANISTAKGPLIIFPGHGDLAKVQALAKTDANAKVAPAKHNGVDTLQLGAGAEQGTAVAIKNHLIVGPQGLVHAAIDASKGGGKGAAGNARVKQLIKVTETGKDFWAVVDVSGELAKQIAGGGSPEAQKLKAGRASLDFASGLGVRLALEFADAAAAKSVADQMSAQVAELAGQPQMAMLGIGGAMKKAKVEQKDKEVKLALDLNQAELDQVKTMLMASMAMMGAPPPGMGAPPPGMPMPPPAPQQTPAPAPAPKKP